MRGEGPALWPELGDCYTNGRDVVEVRAVSPSHIVCDCERVYTRRQFEDEFTKAPPHEQLQPGR